MLIYKYAVQIMKKFKFDELLENSDNVNSEGHNIKYFW